MEDNLILIRITTTESKFIQTIIIKITQWDDMVS